MLVRTAAFGGSYTSRVSVLGGPAACRVGPFRSIKGLYPTKVPADHPGASREYAYRLRARHSVRESRWKYACWLAEEPYEWPELGVRPKRPTPNRQVRGGRHTAAFAGFGPPERRAVRSLVHMPSAQSVASAPIRASPWIAVSPSTSPRPYSSTPVACHPIRWVGSRSPL